jgi:hypothetical protein
MKNGQKLKLGDAHVTPRNIQEVQASKLGDALRHLFFINKNIRSSFKILYFYCFIYYVTRVNSIHVRDEGLRIGGKGCQMNSKVKVSQTRRVLRVNMAVSLA